MGGIEHELATRMAVSRALRPQAGRPRDRRRRRDRPGPRRGLLHRQSRRGRGHHDRSGDCPTCPGLPKIQRDYDAMELKLTRRFASNWSGGISYTLSRLYGNYPGLASSDEIARVAPNVTRLFDGLVMAFRPGGEAGLRPPQHGPAEPVQAQWRVRAAIEQTTLAGVVPGGKRHPDHAGRST